MHSLFGLERGSERVPSFLIQIGSRKMRLCDIELTVLDEDDLDAYHLLYVQLGSEHSNDANRRHNALQRDLVSFERALVTRHQRFVLIMSYLNFTPAAA